jgi:hypothetical protein
MKTGPAASLPLREAFARECSCRLSAKRPGEENYGGCGLGMAFMSPSSCLHSPRVLPANPVLWREVYGDGLMMYILFFLKIHKF